MDASKLIDQFIADLPDWRGTMIARIRKLVHDADADITEEWKWGSPVWTRKGMVCSAGAFKDHVKVNFFRGAALPDPRKLFNAGLDAKKTRAIDIHQGETINEAALKALIRAASALN